MLSHRFTIDKYVIKENKEKVLQKMTKNDIHQTLEGGGSIGKAK